MRSLCFWKNIEHLLWRHQFRTMFTMTTPGSGFPSTGATLPVTQGLQQPAPTSCPAVAALPPVSQVISTIMMMMMMIMMMMAVRGPRVWLLERGPARHGLHQQRALLLRRVRQHLPGRGSVDSRVVYQIFSNYEAQWNYLPVYLKWAREE